MRVLYDYHELLAVVENGVTDLAENATEVQINTHREIKKKDKKTLYFIHQGVNDDVFEKVVGATSSKQAWDILMTSFKGPDRVKKVKLKTLRRQYELLQMEASETVTEYTSRILSLTNQMKIYGEEHTEQAKVEKILNNRKRKKIYVFIYN
ncbi:UBN2 domain-containing protein [Cephalotus follicularis]|uniref:UBN2 domain-containing protein n=1 Tax=Cephalotus follicularis TaxID=3775 RepID=A0A1Q3DE53_CEPFO|nr:UBN2 domain-containing protein [Cephalotus follicularis]